jgi:hypothetical protein
MHKFTDKFDFDNVMSEKSYGLFDTYSQSKLANIMFSMEMQRRYACTSFNFSAVTDFAVWN